MPVRLVWTPQAREDLIEIYLFIGQDNASAAERVFEAIQTKAEMAILHRASASAVPIFGHQREC